MDRNLTTSTREDLDSHSRFEQVFLASPRAQEIYSSMGPTLQKQISPKSAPTFDEVFKMAESFHDKSSHSSSAHSLPSGQSLSLGKPKPFADFLKDKEFEVSPFKPSVNDSTIKKKVSLVISRLEDDDASITNETRNRTKLNTEVRASRDSGFNDMQSDSGGSSEGTFTNILNRGTTKVLSAREERNPTRVDDVNAPSTAGVVNDSEEIHISFESDNDEIDVVSEEDDVQVDDDKNDDNENNDHGDKNSDDDQCNKEDNDKKSDDATDNNNNLATKSTEKSGAQRLDNSTEPPAGQMSKIHVLKLWSIKAVKTRTHMGIIVEGQKNEDPVGELWHSTAIVLRLGPRCVQTKSGSQYKLIGPMNDKLTLQQGFSPEFVKSFKNGFPTNWLSLVADHFNSQSSSESDDDNQVEKQHDKKDKKPSRRVTHSTATPAGSSAKTKQNTTALKTPENRTLPKEVEVKTTRSGRMVKPPLAWWRGQRILTDRHHNLEGIDPGGTECTPRSSLYNVEIKLPLKTEASSPLKQRQSASDSEDRKRRSITAMSKKSQQKELSADETEVPRQQEMESAKQSTKAGKSQELKSPKQPAKGGKTQQDINHPKQFTKEGNSQEVIKSPKQFADKGNTQKEVETTKELSRMQRSPNKSTITGLSQQLPKNQHKGITCEKGVVKPTSTMIYESEQGNSSSSSSEKDNDTSLKKKLFFSPKKSPNKNQSSQGRSNKAELVSEEKRADENRIQEENAQKINVRSDVVQRFSSSKTTEPPASKVDLPNNERILRKRAAKNNQNNEKSANPYTDSESEVVEKLPAPKIPSPPKRVLRSRNKKSNSVKNVEMISDVDSEDGTKNSVKQTVASSCDDGSDSTVCSGKGSKPGGRKRKVEKRVVHKRVSALVRETSTQSSEEDSDGAYHKPSKKQQPQQKASKVIKTNAETQLDSGNDQRAAAGSLLRKEKTELSNRASGKKQASKVSKQTGNRVGSRRQNEMSDDTPWSEDEIQRLNDALYTIPGNTPMFWQKISRKVTSRTAQECQLKHQGQALVSTKKASSVKKVSSKEKSDTGVKASSQKNVKTVTGGVGTIKRKREIRELLEQQDVDYEDDIFDATPFKRKKDLKLPFNLNSNSSDEDDDNDGDDDGDQSDTEHGASYKTPSSRTPSSRFRPLGPLSTSTTPSSEFISPSLLQQVNRKDMDHYIYRMQQGKRVTQGAGKHKAKMRTSTPKKPTSTNHPPVVLGSEIFEVHPASDHDSEEGGDDYYFSDE